MLKSRFEQSSQDISFRNVFHAFFRHRRRATLFFVLVVSAIMVGTFLIPEFYKSESKLLVRVGRESVTLDPTATNSQTVQVSQSRENEIKSEVEILKSRYLAEKVVDTFGPSEFLSTPDEVPYEGPFFIRALRHFIYVARNEIRSVIPRMMSILGSPTSKDSSGYREKAIRQVMKNTYIDSQRENNIIAVSFQAETPKFAQEVLGKIIGIYLDKHIQSHKTHGSYNFFTEQTEQFDKSLVDMEAKLLDAKNKSGIASVEEQRRILVDRIGFFQKGIEQTDTAIAASEARIKGLEKHLEALPAVVVTQQTSGFTNIAADTMRAKLYELQMREQDLLSKYHPDNYNVQEVRRQIAEAKNVLDNEKQPGVQVTRGLNTAHKQLETELLIEKGLLSSHKARALALRKQLEEIHQEMRQYNNSELQIATLQRQLDIQKENYRKYVEKLEQARIDQAMQADKISNISIVQAPTYEITPVRPRKIINLMLGLIIGTLGAFGIVYFSEYADHSLRKPEDVEMRLQLSTLCSVPLVEGNAIPYISSSQGGMLASKIPPEVSKPLEFIRHRLPLPVNGKDGFPLTIAVTSCEEGEGVSFISARLAEIISKYVSGRVLLVDGNMIRPRALTSFGQEIVPKDRIMNRIISPFGAIAKKVLFVAKSMDQSQQVLINHLREKGIEVTEIASGLSALNYIILNGQDMLLLDSPPTGIDLSRFVQILRMNPKTRNIPVFFFIDENTEKDFRNKLNKFIQKREIDGVFYKPYDHQDIVNKIQLLLNNQVVLGNKSIEEPGVGTTSVALDGKVADVDMKLEQVIPFINDPQEFMNHMPQWCREYSVVIVDTPPIWDSTFSSRMVSQVDRVILVVEAERLRWEVVQRGKEFLQSIDSNLMGVILNKRKYPIPDRIYNLI